MSQPPDLVVEPLDTNARIALRGWLSDAASLGIDVNDLDSISAAYDRYVDQVLQQTPSERVDPTPTLTAIAVAMGEYLKRHTALDWRVATDDKGPDLALTASDELGVLFPIDPVAAFWEQQETGWMVEFVQSVMSDFERDQS